MESDLNMEKSQLPGNRPKNSQPPSIILVTKLYYMCSEGLILKAQVHAGGRGKGTLSSGLKGGVKVVKTPEEIGTYAKQMLGYHLKTH